MKRTTKLYSRRDALRRGGIAATAFATTIAHSAKKGLAIPPSVRDRLQKIQIGLVADVHQDVIPDGWARIQVFINEMTKRGADALVQMGDFALPHKYNQPFLDAWLKFEGLKYHVLGNHDTDSGFTKAQTMKWWGMSSRYYSFDMGGWHFVVLDGNDQNPGKWSGYVRYVAQEQRDWLAKDLAETDAPTLVFSHQKLESDDGIANSNEVRQVLEKANRDADWQKVYACLCGHHHTDGLTDIAGIRYIHVNSMSYKWVGAQQKRKRFPDHIERAFPWVSHTAPYRDPLFTMLTLDPHAGSMSIEGKETEFIPPTPQAMNLPSADRMLPIITGRELKII